MKRFSDWSTRLREFEESRSPVPFQWGVNDCCLYACDAIQAITGIDPAESFRGYTTEAEANEKIAVYGSLEKLTESICDECGFSEVPVKFAKRGDVALCEWQGKQFVCVLGTSSHPHGPGERGVVAYPRGCMKRAWSIS